MTPYYEDAFAKIYCGDCREVLPELEPVETCITDPPYGLSFMGRDWDHGVPGEHFWSLVSDVLLPGAMCLAFGGTRTFHRLTCAIEDAGFEIRDCMMWLYGSGFPKSLDIARAVDQATDGEGEWRAEDHPGRAGARVRRTPGNIGQTDYTEPNHRHVYEPGENGAEWHGWGTALKPAWEPVILAMKPLDGTFAENALTQGVAGLNIAGARIPAEQVGAKREQSRRGDRKNWRITGGSNGDGATSPLGRWPANLVLDEESAEMLDEAVPDAGGGIVKPYKRASHDYYSGSWPDSFGGGHDHGGGASRFFYTSKASRADRGPGNDHPTVKPSDLMKWLVKLTATPTGGTILDPFMGSGTTLYAAKEMGRKAIGIELEERYCEIAARRLAQGVLPLEAS